MNTAPILTIELRYEHDVVLARQRARQIAELLGFDPQEQTRLATGVSEIARNAFRYAGGGKVEFAVDGREAPQLFLVRVHDQGPGIADLQAVLDGRYVSATGMGLGIVGAQRLTDRFQIESAPGKGTTVVLGRRLPRRAPVVTPAVLARLAAELARHAPQTPFEEVQSQNQELLRTLEELQARQAEVERLNDALARTNRELEETNRGVLALYAELDEKAQELRRASELKSSFLSNVSHELRTPLSSILNISRLVLDHPGASDVDEHRKQVVFIRKSAQALTEIVNDLLDLAKIEAGKVDVRPDTVFVGELFGTLRGMFRPLLTSDAVALVFDEPPPDLALFTDEGKLSQVLRNFIANAIKFTERGEVRVSAHCRPDETVCFAVADTGIGIAPEHQQRIFEEFAQVEGPLQTRSKGTGLGLPLSRKLARLLGGGVSVRSEPGVGSTFTLTVPRRYASRSGDGAGERPGANTLPSGRAAERGDRV